MIKALIVLVLACTAAGQTNWTNFTGGCASVDEFKFPNGTCSPQCPYPYIVSWRDGSYFCSPPCLTGYYNEQLAVCVGECPSEFMREANGIVYCDDEQKNPYPGNNTNSTQRCDSIYEFKYRNGSCLSDCPYPYQVVWSEEFYFCYPPCSEGSSYYIPSDSCVDDCEQVRVENDIVYCDQLFNSSNNSSNNVTECENPYHYKYPNGSCWAMCSYYSRERYQNGNKFCDPPCPAGQYFYLSGEYCVESCDAEFRGFDRGIPTCEKPSNYPTNYAPICLRAQSIFAMINYDRLTLGEFEGNGGISYFMSAVIPILRIRIEQIEIVSVKESLIFGKVSVVVIFKIHVASSTMNADQLKEVLDLAMGSRALNIYSDKEWKRYKTYVFDCEELGNYTVPAEECDSISDFKYSEGFCAGYCQPPHHKAVVVDGSNFCVPTCTGQFYFYPGEHCFSGDICEFAMGDYDSKRCFDFFLNLTRIASNQGCESLYDYKFPNGSCLSFCPSPYRADWKNISYFCSPPCSNEDYYNTLTEACVDNCEAGSIRAEDDIVYCDQLPNANSTQECDSIYNFKYQNGSCLAECTYPLTSETRNGSLFCNPPCADGQYFYFADSYCVDSCDPEFTGFRDSTLYCTRSPNVPIPINQSCPRGGTLFAVINYLVTLEEFEFTGGLYFFLAQISRVLGIETNQVEVFEIKLGKMDESEFVIVHFRILTAPSSAVTTDQLKAALDLAIENHDLDMHRNPGKWSDQDRGVWRYDSYVIHCAEPSSCKDGTGLVSANIQYGMTLEEFEEKGGRSYFLVETCRAVGINPYQIELTYIDVRVGSIIIFFTIHTFSFASSTPDQLKELLGVAVYNCRMKHFGDVLIMQYESNAVDCEQLPETPSPGNNGTNNTNSTQGCDSIYEFKYANGSCLSDCPYPHIVDWRNGSYFCSIPCFNGDYYYPPNDSCVRECDQIRVENDIVYCELLLENPGDNGTNSTNSTQGCDSIYEFKYANGSCLPDCPYPYASSWTNGSSFCFPPCFNGGYYSDLTKTCMNDCDENFVRFQDGIVYCDQHLNSSNGTNSTNSTQGCDSIYEFKYPNGSCLYDCPYPYKSSWHNGSFFCSFPCLTKQYYSRLEDHCVDSCESGLIRVENEIVYCDERSDTVNCTLISYPNQTTTTNCTDITGICSNGYFVFEDKSCNQICPANFTPRLDATCSSPCGLNRALYPDGNCASTCSLGYTMRMEGSFKYCDQSPSTNNTNESVNLIIEIYIRYNITITDFNSFGGIEKFRQLLALLLGIDPSMIVISNIREGSTIIESQIIVPSESNSGAFATSQSKVNAMRKKLASAASNQGLNLEGIGVLDYSSSIIIPAKTQMDVKGSTSSSGVAIGIGVGAGVVGIAIIGIISYSVYKNKRKQTLTKVKEASREKSYRGEPNAVTGVSEKQVINNQGKDEEICGLADNSVIVLPELIENNLGKIQSPAEQNIASQRIKIHPRKKRSEVVFRGIDENTIKLSVADGDLKKPSSVVLNDHEEVIHENEKPIFL